MTTQVPASPALFPWAAELQSRLGSRPLAAHQRRALASSAQAQSIREAVLSLTSTVGYAAMPPAHHVGQLRAPLTWELAPAVRHLYRRPRFTFRKGPRKRSRFEAMIDMSHTQLQPHPLQPLPEEAPALNARMRAFLLGEAVLEELRDLSREELYEIAGQGHNLYDAGLIDSAQKVFEGLTALDPNDSFFHSGLGAIYQHQGALEHAIIEYDRALALNERDIPSRCNRAEVLLQQGQTEAAIQDLERISELDPHAQCNHTLRARSIALTLLSLVNEP